MPHIHIVALGKLKEKFWREAESEYLKRLTPYYNIVLHEIREESFDEKSDKEKIKLAEAEKILTTLEKIKSENVIALDEHGKKFSSLSFSEFISPLTDIVFVIGGPLGLHQKVIEKVKTKISFSDMTFTHQMIRVFLLEQIYRATTIKIGKKYHY